jgi:uncharacterized protein
MVLSIQAQLPLRPNPPRLVNDFADILNTSEENALERKLVNYNDTTSTQIAVVTIANLQGYDKAQFAVELAEQWEVGQKGKDNGLLILVKPKQKSSRGQAYIAVGYGLEEFVPDATAKNIVEYEMIPLFKEDKIFEGLNESTNILMGLLSGEFTAEQYNKSGSYTGDFIGILFIIVIIAVVVFSGRSRRSYHGITGRSSSFPWWILLFSGIGGSGRGSSWSNFSGGSGSFGGGGSGGFGGFGGGGFGGGGAGGSW